jgi:hypothetical protein
MNSEAETMGKEAVLAWRVGHGTFDGVPLDGLAVVAAVAADKNLGIYEIGGEKAISHTELFVDQRANAAQQKALVAMASRLSNGVFGTVLGVTPTSIVFNETPNAINVTTNQIALAVHKQVTHDPGCGGAARTLVIARLPSSRRSRKWSAEPACRTTIGTLVAP